MVDYKPLAAIILTGLALSGCATGVKGSARRICYDNGLQPGTPAFSNCWKGVRDQQFSVDGQVLQNGLVGAAAIGAAVAAAQAVPPAPAMPGRAKPLKCASEPGLDAHGNPKYVCQ